MSDEMDLNIIKSPGKIMFITWLNNMFVKRQAELDSENKNIIKLSPYASTWFCVGQEETEREPFIGIQGNMIPWFFEMEWKRAIIIEEKGELYLTCTNDGSETNLTLCLKVRKKRLQLLLDTNVENEEDRTIDFRVFKIDKNTEELEISTKVFKRLPLEIAYSKNNIVAQYIEVDDSGEIKTDIYEDKFIKLR